MLDRVAASTGSAARAQEIEILALFTSFGYSTRTLSGVVARAGAAKST
jgi:hypothetical protein